MKTKTHRILFLLHDAHRHGAQILLLNLIKTLKTLDSIEMEVLIKETGVLEKDFKSLVPTTFLNEWINPKNRSNLFNWKKNDQITKIRKYVLSFDTVISNTITNGDLDYFLSLHPCVVTYVHELEQAIRYFTTEEKFHKVLKHSHYLLYPSKAVRDNLISNYGVDAKKFINLPYYIPDVYEKILPSRQSVREELNIDTNESLVIGVGTCDWRKGPDLFLTSMQILFEKNPKAKALWVGANKDSVEYSRMLYDIKKMNIQDRFILSPSTSNPFRYFAAADLFYLSSREDPYPLVVLESAMMNLPCVYFPESGGAKEFLSDDCGLQISYGRIDKAVDLINELLNNNERRQFIANSARSKYLSMHTETVVKSSFINLLHRIHEK